MQDSGEAARRLEELRVLVVDDDPGVRLLLRTYFEDAGSYAHLCRSASAALAALRDQTFDLVLADIVMADMSGLELLERVREWAPGVGVVLITAHPERHGMSAALRAGADGYLTKPFSLSKLEAAVTRAYWNALERARPGPA